MRDALRQSVAPLYLLLCLVLGGGAEGIWRNLALQLIAVVIIAWAAIERPSERTLRPARQLALIVSLALLLLAMQLVPLPPSVWSALPGRQPLIEGYQLLGQTAPWLPISLTPYSTMAALPWLLPPLAMLAAILRLKAYRTSWLVAALLAGTILGVLLGALQVSSSPGMQWYLYRITNPGFATGFFANKNHMATLLLVSIPFLAALFARAQGGKPQHFYPLLAAGGGVVLIIIVGLALNRSVAGWGLALPVLIASSLIVAKGWARATGAALGVSSALAAIALLTLFVAPVHDRLGRIADTSVQTRTEIFSSSTRAALEFAPMGSGFGSFVETYRMFEDPSRVDTTYVNHAHNDYLELLIETGLPGLLLLLLFLAWWGSLAIQQWRGAADAYGRAASIATAAILAHSIVDYPLRTAAIAAVFAMCLGVMAQSRVSGTIRPRTNLRDPKHLEVG